MIRIGLAGWGDHDALYPPGTGAQDKLRVYGRTFPIVEVDSSFYAIQPERNYEKWARETPAHFGFVVKAFQGMTGHQRGKPSHDSTEAMFAAFLDSIRPLREAGKLKAVLFQYPPWFDCDRKHVDALRYAKERMGDVPLALEFRNRTWFEPDMRERTLSFMKREGWAHSICDEPQAGIGSVPIVPEPTHPGLTIVRFHGRHAEGWHSSGEPNWRDVRYLYRYSREELEEWAERLNGLRERTDDICVIFNNNSGGDAAANAIQLAGMLGLGYPELPTVPVQLDLFE
ncbi:DUF72 domain-containing protein [Paenibacillus flagellatus]|uniref:DUF72 domain-containing protein n=1 Tax=Paenibacillus flagellatus TaxID=2211139 RepID=A0A2V5K228_9BACL|nr:DUF72 domain-containing protein [Paenibacillus flagellatus]PYI52712.1 DUF72 domain-containing protein [Paenibacillus flagellatus]